MARKPETNFTHCTRACPTGEHKHYVTGGITYIRHTLTRDDTHRCSTAGNHWHRTETVSAATLLQRFFPSRRQGRL